MIFSPGDRIEFHGENTASDTTYLFITGPGMSVNGSQIQSTDPKHSPVDNNTPATFKQMDVQGDHTGSWKWGTASTKPDTGTYTVYAVARPHDKENLDRTPYGTVSISLKKPFESSTTPVPATTPAVAPSPGCSFQIALIGLGAVAVIAGIR
jgi:hypothetical protein